MDIVSAWCVTHKRVLTVDQITFLLSLPPQECSQRRLNLEEQVKALRTEVAEEEKQTKKMSRDIQVKMRDVSIVVKLWYS